MAQFERGQASRDSSSDPRNGYDERRRPKSFHTSLPPDDGFRANRPHSPSQWPSNSAPQPQPIKDAIGSAIRADASDKYDPDLIAHIADAVLKSLQKTGFSGVPQQSSSSSAQPGLSANVPPRNVITPPSPVRRDVPRNPSPSKAYEDHMEGAADCRRYQPPPREKSSSPLPKERQRSDTTQSKNPSEDAPSGETTLEKIWQPLFDQNGLPTVRLGQFLRGLAIHIMDDYEPKRSLVITPQKMLRFYEDFRIAHEVYPWNTIFGGKMSHSSLSHLYRDLQCQHHFTQGKNNDKPSVPSLTPVGFETWMTCLIRAHPDEEYQRFSAAVLRMPISNADDCKERFPKELSWRLFPKQEDSKIRMDLEDAIYADPVVEQIAKNSARPAPSVPPAVSASTGHVNDMPPPPNHSTQMPPNSTYVPPASRPTNISGEAPRRSGERDRPSFSNSSSEVAVEDNPPSKPIERERKPYSAQPGGGKVFDDELRPVKSQPATQSRSDSNAASLRPQLDPEEDFGPPPRYRTGSLASGQPPPPPSSKMRPRSPSMVTSTASHTRSEGDMPPTGHRSSVYINGEGSDLRRTQSKTEKSRRTKEDDLARDLPPSPPRSTYGEENFRRAPYPTGDKSYVPPPPPPYARY